MQSKQGWHPQHEVELIAGTPPGGGQDRPARALMSVLASAGAVGVPMQLVNLPGRGGANAWQRLRERPADGHALAISSATLITNRLLGVTDFDHAALTPLAMLYTEYIAFVVRRGSTIVTADDLLARLRADRDRPTIALATALGNTNHIALSRIARHAGGDAQALPLEAFDSALYAVAEVVEGRAEVGAITAVSAVKALESGALRTIAVSAPERLGGLFAGVPTWAELGVPCVMGQWRGIVGAPDIAADQIAWWEHAVAAATAQPAWTNALERQYWSAMPMGAAQTRDFLDAERDRLDAALAELGLIARA